MELLEYNTLEDLLTALIDLRKIMLINIKNNSISELTHYKKKNFLFRFVSQLIMDLISDLDENDLKLVRSDHYSIRVQGIDRIVSESDYNEPGFDNALNKVSQAEIRLASIIRK